MRRLPIIGLLLGLIGILGFLSWWVRAGQIKAVMADQVVISEIQIEGTNGANDEFVELYNPLETDVVMTNWRLTKRSSSGGSALNIVNPLNGTIPAHGFYLLAHPAYSGGGTPGRE